MQAGTTARGRSANGGRCASAWAGIAALLLAGCAGAQSAEPGPVTDAAPPAPESHVQPTVPAEAPADPRAEALAARDAAQQTLLRLLDEERYEEAVTIAQQVVDLSRQVYGADDIQVASPLVNLATAQMRAGNLAGAELNYQAAIALIERREGLVSPRLVNPLVGLGDTYLRSAFYVQARETYERALLVNHAEQGFYNLEQIKVLDGLSEAYLGMDKLTRANAQQRQQVEIYRRRSGDDSAEAVEALYKLGRWYNRTGQFSESRDAYQTARRIIRESRGPSDPAAVDALIGEALTYENEGATPASASTLKRALDLLDKQPDPDPLKRAEVLVALGDLYTFSRQFRSAAQRYGQAWQELSGGDPALLEQRARYFSRPSRIAGPRLPVFVGPDGKEQPALRSTRGELAQGTVLARLTVNAQGEAQDVTIIESDPPEFLDQQVIRALDATAFRPQLADGDTVASEGVLFRHDFRYPRQAPSDTSGSPAETPDTQRGGQGRPIEYPGEAETPDE